MKLSRFTVGSKLLVASIGVLLVAVTAVAGVGTFGLARTNLQAEQLYGDSLLTIEGIADLRSALSTVHASVVERVLTTDPERQAHLDHDLDEVLIPQARQSIVAMRVLALRGLDVQEHQFATRLDDIEADLAGYLLIRQSGVSPSGGGNFAAVTSSSALVARLNVIFDEMQQLADEMQVEETDEAAVSYSEASRSYDSTRLQLAASIAVSLLGGVGIMLLLIHNVVPRIRDYSKFAADVAADRAPGTLEPRGNDELSDLGRALNDLVANNEMLALREALQAEYADTLQVTATEDEAHELVQRHIERSIPASAVVVVKRNNSASKLEAATALEPDTDFGRRIIGAEPRSCLALRFARTHREGTLRPPLLSCALCANRNVASTCEPLLVGGEVIGSVLVSHQQLLDGHQDGLIKNSVSQAAPVLANLRNLALAEFRANNDSLTGLPNKRATDETLKRMVAQANRSITPLAAAILDLDNFKQINDRFGHGKGDEVLAAVGAALKSCLRASDFAGRFGGEEFLILLPETTIEGAVQVAEKIRAVIGSITVTGVEREITASLGIAGLIETAGGATGLLREADRALYAAKAAGRNRTVVATMSDLEGRSQVNVGEPIAALRADSLQAP